MKTSRLCIAILFIGIIFYGIISDYNSYNSNTKANKYEKFAMVNSELLLQSNENIGTEEIEVFIDEGDSVEIIEEKYEEEVAPIVFDNLTIEELGVKIERNLNSTLIGNGQVFANSAIELGVDPYLALAIVLHETGCSYNCSYLTNSCNNIGGQKGSGCGEYAYFSSLEEGIYAFLKNLSNNYFSYGLNTAETIGPKYAEDPEWSIKVNRHLEKIKNN